MINYSEFDCTTDGNSNMVKSMLLTVDKSQRAALLQKRNSAGFTMIHAALNQTDASAFEVAEPPSQTLLFLGLNICCIYFLMMHNMLINASASYYSAGTTT